MKWIIAIILLSILAAQAEESRIIDVRRNITLSDDDKVYKDFYINAGDSTFKKGQTLTASRKINIRDASGATSFGEIKVPVGELKVIAVYDKVTVARQVKLLDREDLPMIEQRGVMTGDLIDPKK